MALGAVIGAVVVAPEKLYSMLVSSAILAVIAIPVYIVFTIGFMRPFWTHHTMDLEACARESSMRLVKRAEEIRTCLEDYSEHPVMQALKTAYPNLVEFAQARGPGPQAVGGDRSELEAADDVFDGMIGVSDGGRILTNAHKLAEGPPVNTIIDRFATDMLLTAGDKVIPAAIQRSVCAVADARLLSKTVALPLRTMNQERTRKMDLPETVKYHVQPELDAYVGRIRKTLEIAQDSRTRAAVYAVQIVSAFDGAADIIMWGERREGFGIGKIFKLAGSLIKMVVPLSKLVITIVSTIIDSIDDVVNLLQISLEGVKFIATELKKGVVPGVVAIARIVVGLTIKVAVTLLRVVLTTVITAILVFWYPVLISTFLTLIFGVVLASRVLIAIVDSATGGSLRCLNRTDQDPNAWWKQAGFELGNVFTRNIVVWRPCFNGYVVSDSGVFCERIDMGVPTRSPTALLARLYFKGSFGEVGRKVPARDPVSLERYTRLCNVPYRSFLNSNPFVEDLAKTLALCRRTVLGHTAEIEELAHYIGHVDPETGGEWGRSRLSVGACTIILSALVATVGFSAKYLSRP